MGKNAHQWEKMRISGKFAFQLDESTDISGHAQLLANVRFVDRRHLRKRPVLQGIARRRKNRRGNISGRIRIS